MANYKLNDNNVNFYVKPEVTFSVGNKIIYAKYDTNDYGDIIWHKPIINAIDIDWQNAVTDEITDAINTSGKLISIISNNKKSIRLTNEAITSIRTQISDIEHTLETIEIGDNLPILNELRDALNTLSERVTALEEGNIEVDLTDIQNAINAVNERIDNLVIPRYVNDLVDGYDVLRRSQFEVIKDQLKGDSAYDIAKKTAQENSQSFPYNTEAEWIASLKGQDGEPGENGLSAYDIAKRTANILHVEFPYANETEWMTAIINGNDTKAYTDQKINELREEFTNNQTDLTAGEGIIIENNVISASANTWINL